ncbi:uncharacterized protein RCC_08865 [Ramularia collo-cygni]|uniref:Hydrophobin n=1 Tax=Ramularia collo-cygni TaxID=112498 RepID=A0A2D3VBU6_9PEZI|nr:uncharacterized protein RCC_08865 [Ramularia collo-cygni]CZT23155.1 uncharacterized protein RCC_08865 [Ramularia collo-cygni]
MQPTLAASVFALFASKALAAPGLVQDLTQALPLSHVPDYQAPQCRDGGQLHCCQATFSGSAAPVTLLADLACYDLTPAVVNCVITEAPIDPEHGCVGEYSCCQVNDLNPLLGLFCSKPPGDCVGDEANGRCTDVIGGRFGHCSDNDVRNNRLLEGLGL